MKRSLIGLLIITPLVAGLLLYIIFQFTDPATVGPAGLLGVFILIYLGCLSILFILLRFGLYAVSKMLSLRRGTTAHGAPQMGARKAYYIASVLAFAPVTFLAMHAYSQVGLTDIMLVSILMAIITFYILKRR